MVERQRLHPDERIEQILAGALEVAKNQGYKKLTREAVAAQCDVSAGQINRFYHTMHQLRRGVMRRAVIKVKNGDTDIDLLKIIGHGIAQKMGEAMKAPDKIKEIALKSLME